MQSSRICTFCTAILFALPVFTSQASGSETPANTTTSPAFSIRVNDVIVGPDAGTDSDKTLPAFILSTSGNVALVGAGWQNGFRGAAYFLQRRDEGWTKVQEILPPDGSWPGHFGEAVWVDGEYAAVGAPWHGLFAGAVHVYKNAGDIWVEQARLAPARSRPDDRFGESVLLVGDRLVVKGRNSTWVFRREGDRWTETHEPAELAGPDRFSAAPSPTPQLVAAVGALQARGGFDLEPAAVVLPDSLAWVAATDSVFENRVEVRWPSLNESAVLYKIYRDRDANPDTLIWIASSDDSLYADLTGLPGITYTYSVVVSDLMGGETTPTSDAGTRVIFQPVDMQASDGDYEDHVEIVWSDRSEIEAGYLVSREPGPDTLAVLGPNAGLYRDSTAVPGDSYLYGVLAFDAGGNGNAPVTDEGYAGHILPPIQVDATDGQYPDRVVVAWVNQTANAQSLYLYRELVGVEPTVPFDTLLPDETQYTDMTATPGVHYVYCVSAMDSVGHESAFGCDEGGAGTLQPPTSVEASDGTYDDRVAISWAHGADTQDGFRIYRALSGQPDSMIAELPAADRSYDDMDALPDSAYTYGVEAFSDHGGTSSRVSDAGRRSVVLRPDWITATDGTFEDRVDIEWESSSTTAVIFKITRDGEPIKTVAGNVRSYSDYDIPSDSVFEYAVSAVTAFAQESDATTDSGRRHLEPPTSVQATDNAFEERVDVTWANVSEVADGYRVYRKAVEEASPVLIASLPATRESFSDKTGAPDLTYDYSVRAFHVYGVMDTTESGADSDTGYRVLPPPTEVEASDGEFEDRIRISWVDNARFEEGYQVWRKPAGSGEEPAAVAWLPRNATSYMDDAGIVFGDVYEYTVMAVDSALIGGTTQELGASKTEQDEGFTTILAPAEVNASDTYEDRVVVAWVDQSRIEDGYEVSRDGVSLTTVPANATTYTDDSVLDDGGHEYCVRTYSGALMSVDSCDWGQRVPPPQPDAPAYLQFELIETLNGGGPGGDSFFEHGLDISDDTAIVGGYPWTPPTSYAHVFRWNGSHWSEEAELTPDDCDQPYYFGRSVAISGDAAIAGCHMDTSNGFQSGAAYVFRWNGANWIQEAKLIPADQSDGQWFGASVALQGDVALVGAERGNPGAAYVFRWNGLSWTQEAKLTVEGATALGASIALAGDVALVGAYRHAYVFRYNGSSWTQEATLSPDGGGTSNRFGESVSLSEDVALVGDFWDGDGTLGAAYVFRWNGSGWIREAKLTASDPEGSDYFGYSLSLSGNVALISAPSWAPGLGNKAYVFRWNGASWVQEQKLSIPDTYYTPVALWGDRAMAGVNAGQDVLVFAVKRPLHLAATDGTYGDRVQLRWQDSFVDEQGYNIYRDGMLLDLVPPSTLSFFDSEAEPGRTHKYDVTAFGNGWESAAATDLGYRRPNGSITGRIMTAAGAGVGGVQVQLEPTPNRALLFDGVFGRLRVDEPALPDTALTVEFWVRTNPASAPGDILFSVYRPALAIFDSGDLRLAVNGDSTVAAGVSIDDGRWHHVALTWRSDGGEWQFLENGSQVAGGSGLSANVALLQPPAIGFGGAGFHGELDDIRIWDHIRTEAEITATMAMPLRGDEAGLVGYWPLDQETSDYAQDLTHSSRYARLKDGVYWTTQAAPLNYSVQSGLEGDYSLNRIRYRESSAFRVRPLLPPRQFQPAYRTVTLSTASPVENQVDFSDVSSFTISGSVTYAFADSSCPVANAEILVDEEVRGTTDGYGEYSVTVMPGNNRTLGIRLADHTFIPSQRRIDVTQHIADIDFLDTTTRTLSGRVGGGCGYPIGTMTLLAQNEDGCLNTIIVSDSTFDVSLPPEAYSVEVGSITPPSEDTQEFFDRMGAQEVDLTTSPDTVQFIYRAPLVLNVVLPELPACPFGPGDSDVPIVQQGDVLPVLITLSEDYGNGNACPLDHGTVTIYDQISDLEKDPTVLEVKDGQVLYTVSASTPNIFAGLRDSQGHTRDYQKWIMAIAEVPGRDPAVAQEWVLVTGNRPRAASFTAVSEGIPLLILRDPPGDGSYSFIEKGESVCTTFNDIWATSTSTGASFYFEVKGPAVLVRTSGGFELGVDETTEHQIRICATARERIATSSNDLFVGPDGDLYLGVALKYSFAKTDVITIEDCLPRRTESIAISVDDIETTYLFTEAHIRDTVIPQLEQLMPQDSLFYSAAISNWQSHLERNHSLKENAVLRNNRSFSAGTEYEFTQTSERTESETVEIRMSADAEAALEAGVGLKFLGWKWYYGGKLFLKVSSSTTTRRGKEGTASRTVGYVLTDNDIGDFFSVDVKDDRVYGTPVFTLDPQGGGASSCPWEQGTQPRDGPRITTSNPILRDVPPDEQAVFNLELYNDSQSDEIREYFITPIGTSNPGGAILRVNGTLLETEGMSFFLDPYSEIKRPYEVTLAVERGPTKYKYEDLAMMLVPKCEYERWQRGVMMDLQVSDTLKVTVEFTAPCSDITLADPMTGWAFGEAAQDSLGNIMPLTLSEFEFAAPDTVDSLLFIGAEYRRKDTEQWVRIRDPQIAPFGRVSRSTLRNLMPPPGDPFGVTLNWDLSDVTDGRTPVADGVCDLRAFTECGGGLAYSAIATGRIDRVPPKPLGKPQPADGVLSLGENISVRFNEAVDCGALEPENFLFTYLEGTEPETVTVEWSCSSKDGIIVITPVSPSLAALEGKILSGEVQGVRDVVGNPSAPVAWDPSFKVEQRSFNWAQTTITREVSYRNPEPFSVNLVNGLAVPLDFRIENLPTWLIAEPDTATVPSRKSLPILFEVLADDTLAIGDSLSAQIEAVAYGAGPDTVRAALEIGLKLVCRPPTWALNPSNFEYTMNSVVELSICPPVAMCEISTDPADVLAAFVGNQIRGVARPQAVTVNGVQRHLYFLTIYSNLSWGETVRFRIWDDSECLLYTDADTAFTFSSNAVVGSADDPFALTGLVLFPGDEDWGVPVNEGWTWFSLNQRSNVDILTPWEVLGNLNPEPGDLVKSQTEFCQFSPASGWDGSLVAFDNVSMYMIHISEAGTIRYQGNPAFAGSTPVPIGAGWNWIGYVPGNPTSIDNALAGITASLSNRDLIKSQFAFAQYDAAGGHWVGSLTAMEPGLGYKLFLAAPTDPAIIYPSVSKPDIGETAAAPPLAGAAGGEEAGGSLWSVEPRAYQYNMTVTAALSLGAGEVLSPQHVVAAFVGDDVRGVARPIWVESLNRHLVFLMIYGNEPADEEILFRAYDPTGGTFFDIDERIPFEADGIAGSIEGPIVLTGHPAEPPRPLPAAFSLGRNYPNPLGPTAASTVIPYALPREVHVQLRVFDVSGRLVDTIVDENQPPGWYEVPFDATGTARGVYFYVLRAGEFRQVRKMTVLR